MSKSYADKLRDPRWQKKRLEIMERDGFSCRSCKNKERTLNVHHLKYEKGKEPWEYEESEMVTLCEGCHEQVKEVLKLANLLLVKAGSDLSIRLLRTLVLAVGFHDGFGKEEEMTELIIMEEAIAEIKAHKICHGLRDYLAPLGGPTLGLEEDIMLYLLEKE